MVANAGTATRGEQRYTTIHRETQCRHTRHNPQRWQAHSRTALAVITARVRRPSGGRLIGVAAANVQICVKLTPHRAETHRTISRNPQKCWCDLLGHRLRIEPPSRYVCSKSCARSVDISANMATVRRLVPSAISLWWAERRSRQRFSGSTCTRGEECCTIAH